MQTSTRAQQSTLQATSEETQTDHDSTTKTGRKRLKTSLGVN